MVKGFTVSTLQSIHIYPIKSAAGIAISKTWVDHLGLSFDRRFVLSDHHGNFITARTEPTLCLIEVHLTATGLMLNAPNMPSLRVDYQLFNNNYQSVTVWKSQINAQHCLEQYDLWFSQYLNRPCQLLFFGEQSKRLVKNSSNSVGFADGYPLLLISQGSLDDFNQRANLNFEMSRFRPNLIVENTAAFEEDAWRHIRIGEVEFELVKPCSRCIFTTVDPNTAEKHTKQEPLTTLTSYRQVASGDVMFGQNLLPLNQGAIKQGDKVEVLSYQSPPEFIRPKQSKRTMRITPKEQLAQNKKSVAEMTITKKVNIHFESWNKKHSGDNQSSILEQGESAGLILPYSCRAGMCGRCKVKLQSGEVKQLATDGLSDEEQSQGYILACSCLPLSDVTVSKVDKLKTDK